MRDSARLGGLREDATYALRSLRRSPGFALLTAAVVGLGVGATTAVFSVLKPLLLAPLPLEDPERLVWIANESDNDDNSLSAVTSRSGNLRDFRERTRSFEALTGYNAFFDQSAYTLTGAGEPQRLVGAGVAHDFLDVLGVEPLLGRSFTAEEGAWGGPPTVILSHGFWRQRFGADRGIVGRAITLNERPREVVGVLPPSFDFSEIFTPGVEVDFLLPFPVSDETDRQGNTMVILGRLKPGVTPEAAQADLDAVLAGLQEAQPDRWGLGAELTRLQAHIAEPLREALLLLAAAAGTVLLIVCVNVSNLLLARSPGRAREMAVRKALGASRGRLARQLVLESLGMALAGAALGGLLAWGATSLVAGTQGVRIPLLDQVRVDGLALLFAAGVAVVTGLVVGLAPALAVTEGSEAEVLRVSGRWSSAGRSARRIREGLVVAEVALACVLLVVGGLLLRSFGAVLDVDLGFEPEGVVAWQLNPGLDFESLPEAVAFYAALTDRVQQVPGVESVGLIDASPLGRSRSWGFRVAGVPPEEDPDFGLYPHMVDAGYLPAMRIPLVEGRNLTPDDTRDTRPVILMNESGARRVFPDRERLLGGRIQLWDERQWEVVGIVEDVRHLSPEMDAGIQVYFPMAQLGQFGTMDLVVRSGRPAEQTTEAVSAALRQLDPSMPTRESWTLQARVDRAVSPRRFTLGILSAFGAAALLLAGLGIYGVLAQSVAERTPEIGIRMALGASGGRMVRTVLGRTLFLAGVGVAVGALASLWGTRMLRSLLYGVEPGDPVTFLGMAVILLGVAALAGALPAARAARIRGVRALRAE